MDLESQDGAKRYLPHFLVFGTYLFAAVRFFSLTSQYAVNVFWWDQWDFDDATLFQDHSIWQAFRWQHGPHRQGLGALLQKLIEPWIHWNSRYEAFGIGAIIFITAALALLLKTRLYGAIGYSDVIIPLLFLTPLQYETLAGATNPAYSSLPLLLTVLYCLCWLIRPYSWKYICVLLVNFLLIYTGFGIFVGLVTPVLLALDHYTNIRHLGSKYHCGAAAVFMISIGSLASFFVGYKLQPAADCFTPAVQNPVIYLWFVDLMFANAAGLKILNPILATLIGSIALSLLLLGLMVVVKRLLTRKADTWSRDAAIAVLLAYCATFSLSNAYGRLCLGLVVAGYSRYVPFMVIGFFGLYLYALSIHSRNLRVSLVLVLLLFAMLSARPLNRRDTWIVEQISNGKSVWRECYLVRHDIHECDTVARFKINPRPKASRLQEKLDFLEHNHLNLYDNSH